MTPEGGLDRHVPNPPPLRIIAHRSYPEVANLSVVGINQTAEVLTRCEGSARNQSLETGDGVGLGLSG
jgi:hypothetical protein